MSVSPTQKKHDPQTAGPHGGPAPQSPRDISGNWKHKTVSQDMFRAALLDASADTPDGLQDGNGRGAGRRYAVYRNNVAVSLRDALATGFPAVARVLGDDNFARLAGAFLRGSPPTSPLMMHYGEDFPAFLESIEALAKMPWLGDLARLELAMRRSYHAGDAAPMDPAILQNIEEEALLRARLGVAPAVQIVVSPWPLLAIYRYALGQTAERPAGPAQDLIVLRPEFDPEPHVLPPGGAAFVAALQKGQGFGDALAQAGDSFDLPGTLGLLLQGNALTGLRTQDQEPD